MKVTFWGVRGCIPAPGPETNRYGGNTPCVSVETRDGSLVILDAGTGLTVLGKHLMSGEFGRGQGHAALLISHAHWDHIQGFPFFPPVFLPGNKFDIYGQGGSSGRLEDILEGQMSPHYNPVQSLKNLGADITFHELSPGDTFKVGAAEGRCIEVPHGPTSCLAFRIQDGSSILVYCPDISYPNEETESRVASFFQGAGLLIHDATYSDEDWVERRDRGFSSVGQAVRMAARAGVETLVLFHYDQDYDDATVDELADRARKQGAALGLRSVVAAREGLVLEV